MLVIYRGGTLLEDAHVVLVAVVYDGVRGTTGDGGIPLGGEPHATLTELRLATCFLHVDLSPSPPKDDPSLVSPPNMLASPPSVSI